MRGTDGNIITDDNNDCNGNVISQGNTNDEELAEKI